MSAPDRALLIVDAQNDFTEGGALGVDGATDAFHALDAHLSEHASDYGLIVTTQDWHIDPGDHWSENPDFEHTWPVHCAAGTSGAELNPIVVQALRDAAATDLVRITKGERSGAYSGFEGADPISQAPLAEILRQRGITRLDVVGVATDHCVRATVLDALTEGFGVRVLTGMIAGVDAERSARALDEMTAKGAALASS